MSCRPHVVVVSALMLAGSVVAQDFTVSVPNRVLRRMGRVLPARSNASRAFVSENYASGVTFASSGTARIIFLDEGAGYRSALGYFTYTENLDGSINVVSSDLLIRDVDKPNAVTAGDGYDLRDAGGSIRTFAAGEKLGFFILADVNRTDPALVSGWTYSYSDSDGQVPDPDPEVNATRGRGCYTTVSSTNPEITAGQPDKARHMVMVEMPGLTGFQSGADYLMCAWEDLNRTGNTDDDFNDMVFVLEITPYSAITGTPVFRYEPGDPDNDGVRGLNDEFPNDPDRATLQRIPSTGMNLLAFEDSYPIAGDQDFNDAVIAYYYQVAKDAAGDVKDIVMTTALVARGASNDASFGLHLPGLPQGAAGTIDIERFVSGTGTAVLAPQRTIEEIVNNGTRRVEDIIDSTATLLPALSGSPFSNTLSTVATQPAGSARLKMTFGVAVDPDALGPAPWDPFLYVDNPNYQGTRVDIHLPGKPSFADRRVDLPLESGIQTFIDLNGYPWVLELPTGWRFPQEAVDIDDAYPLFANWRASNGTENKDWYRTEFATINRVGVALYTILPVRNWTLKVDQ